MNTLLVFFAIPLSTIILSAIFETFIESPIKVSGIFFAVSFVVAIYLGGTADLILASIIYSLISFFTALIVYLLTEHHICKIENTSALSNNIPRCKNFR